MDTSIGITCQGIYLISSLQKLTHILNTWPHMHPVIMTRLVNDIGLCQG